MTETTKFAVMSSNRGSPTTRRFAGMHFFPSRLNKQGSSANASRDAQNGRFP